MAINVFLRRACVFLPRLWLGPSGLATPGNLLLVHLLLVQLFIERNSLPLASSRTSMTQCAVLLGRFAPSQSFTSIYLYVCISLPREARCVRERSERGERVCVGGVCVGDRSARPKPRTACSAKSHKRCCERVCVGGVRIGQVRFGWVLGRANSILGHCLSPFLGQRTHGRTQTAAYSFRTSQPFSNVEEHLCLPITQMVTCLNSVLIDRLVTLPLGVKEDPLKSTWSVDWHERDRSHCLSLVAVHYSPLLLEWMSLREGLVIYLSRTQPGIW